MRVLRFFDWRFWTVFLLVLTVLFIVFEGFSATHESEIKTQQVNALIAQNDAQAIEFTKDRDALLVDQRLLLTYTKQLAERQDALLAYLRKHGIRLPTQYVTTITPPKLIYVQAPSKGGGAGSSKPGKHPGGHK